MEDALPPLNDDMIGRHFANATMHWKVGNISLALCTPNVQVDSPEFTLSGPVPTRWKMSLDISAEDNRMLLNLAMLPSKIKNLKVKVNWIASVMDPKYDSVALAVERAHTFEPNCRMTVDVFELWSVISKVPDASPDVLKIRCSMLVQFGYNPQFPKAESNGIMSLSKDLLQLTKESLFSDVSVQVKDFLFPMHRAMLSIRSDYLDFRLQSQAEGQSIRLHLSDHDAVDSLFSYLYTGDLSFILSNPSIMICDYIKRLDIPELKNLYPLEKLKMESKLGANEQIFGWTVADFRDVKEPLSSQELTADSLDSRWKMHLYPCGPPDGKEQRKNFLFLEAELLYSARPIIVCLEFASVNDKGRVILTRRIHGCMKVGDRVGLVFFRVGGTNMEKSLVNGALCLRLTVRIATGEVIPFLMESHTPTPLPINCERTYLTLSKVMGFLLTIHEYCDVGLIVENQLFQAHRFVLAARSPMFKKHLEARANERKVMLTIPKVNKHVFRVFLEFLYTGLLNDSEASVLMQLYDFSRNYGVRSLIWICLNFLIGFVNPDNVLQLYLWSNERQETRVMTRCLNIIALLGDAIKNHHDWTILSEANPRVCDDILHFLRNNRNRTLPIVPEGLSE